MTPQDITNSLRGEVWIKWELTSLTIFQLVTGNEVGFTLSEMTESELSGNNDYLNMNGYNLRRDLKDYYKLLNNIQNNGLVLNKCSYSI